MKKQIIIFIIFFAVGFLAFKFAADYFKKNNSISIEGNWVLETDPLSSLIITDKTLKFSYEGSESSSDNTYNYVINQKSEETSVNSIKIFNTKDTLRYEILAKNDTLLNLMDLQYGSINTYILKK
jgi:hypothetical protein